MQNKQLIPWGSLVLVAILFPGVGKDGLNYGTLSARKQAQPGSKPSGKEIGLVINEVYYSGPTNDHFYWYDQFVELYNASDSTVYLDGLIFSRTNYNVNYELLESTHSLQVLHCYQFPGKVGDNRFPVKPHHYVVIAKDARDHSQLTPGALNLEQADWEFFNPYGGDVDNPRVPNVVNMFPDKKNDFNLNLDRGTVLLSYLGEIRREGKRIYIRVDDVLDAVEYAVTPQYRKKIPRTLDAGVAAIGLHRYSGKSIQRIRPGYDTNNSSIDFVITSFPTAGK